MAVSTSFIAIPAQFDSISLGAVKAHIAYRTAGQLLGTDTTTQMQPSFNGIPITPRAHYEITPAALSATGVVAAATVTAAGYRTVVSATGVISYNNEAVYLLPDYRNITVKTSNTSVALPKITIWGYDCYMQPMCETIQTVSNGTANGKKAFLGVTRVYADGALDSGITLSVGYGTIVGLPIALSTISNVVSGNIVWNATVYPISTANMVKAAVVTTPATATTGDVRGTIDLNATTVVPTGSILLVVDYTCPLATGVNQTTAGTLGVTQFTQPYI